MNKVVFAFFCLALLGIVTALECYTCSGPTCEKELKTWTKTTCGSSGITLPANSEYYCQKLSYKEKGEKKVKRQCAIITVKDGKPNTSCPTAVGDDVQCPLCKTDLCNSAPSVSLSFVTLCGVVMAAFLPKLL